MVKKGGSKKAKRPSPPPPLFFFLRMTIQQRGGRKGYRSGLLLPLLLFPLLNQEEVGGKNQALEAGVVD